MRGGLGIGPIEAALFAFGNRRAGLSQFPSMDDSAERLLATQTRCIVFPRSQDELSACLLV